MSEKRKYIVHPLPSNFVGDRFPAHKPNDLSCLTCSRIDDLERQLTEAQENIEQLRTALNQQGHMVEFTVDGWSIEHPVECRKPSLLDCPLHSLFEEMKGPPTEGPGRYKATISDDGNLLLDRILSKKESG